MSVGPRLLVVYQSRGGGTASLCEAAVAGAHRGGGDGLECQVLGAFDAGPDEVLWAQGVLLGTPAHFGYMSGALKDFFERIYYPCLGHTTGMPYSLFVKGSTDTDGAVASVERIAVGLSWKRALPPVVAVGELEPAHIDQAGELGATFAAGMEAGIF